MQYKELLRSPLWQKRRLSILDRDNWTCKFCGSSHIELQVHHLVYLPEKEPWNYPDEYLVTLCAVCHQDEEKLKFDDKFLLGNILMAGIKRRDLYSLASSLRTYFDADKENRLLKLHEFLNG